MYERIKKWYRQGLWMEQMVQDAVYKGVITRRQAYIIVNGTDEE